MTQCILDALATAVTADLSDPANAGHFSAVAEFDKERISALDFSVESLPASKPKAFIFGADERRNILNRVKTEREWDVEICVASRLANDRNATVDPLRALVEQIGDFWEFRQPTGIDKQKWVAMEVLPYIPELIKELTFIGVVKLTFKGIKP